MSKNSVELILQKKNATDTIGTVTLRVLIPGTRKYKKKSLGYRVPEKYWDIKSKKVTTDFPNHKVINNQISTLRNEFEAELILDITKGKKITKNHIIAKLYKDTETMSVRAYIERHIDRLKGKGHAEGTIKDWKAKTIGKLELTGNEALEFTDINTGLLHDYEAAIRANGEKKDLAGNTAYAVMRKLREVLKMAEYDGLFDMKTVKGYKWPKYREPARSYLTLEETDKIADAVYQGKLTTGLEVVACYFLVECYAGIRFSDWGRFEIEKIMKKRSLKVGETQKTKQPIYIYMDKSPRLERIVKHIFTKKYKWGNFTDQYANRALKTIAKEVGIKKPVTTHVGRHTNGVLMLELGYSRETIAEMLGVSVRTVETYARMTRRKIDSEYQRLGGL